MAMYVTSDAHGHVRALDEALELAAPGNQDHIFVLGDMIDRGPSPIEVIKLVRGLPNVHVLMGNHEQMLLDTLRSSDEGDVFTWAFNGGSTTMAGLDALPHTEYLDVMDWLGHLPFFAITQTLERSWILVHAGIDTLAARGYLATAGIDTADGKGASSVSLEMLGDMMMEQSAEDLVWIREPFWRDPTGFVGVDGTGPVIVAGHTPSILLHHFADGMGNAGMTDEGYGCVVPVGASEETGGVPDRFDIDCSAAAGPGQGRVGVMRLDDGEIFYATIKSGE